MTELIINTEAQLIDFLHQLRKQINTLGTQVADMQEDVELLHTKVDERYYGDVQRDQRMIAHEKRVSRLDTDVKALTYDLKKVAR